MHFDLTHLTAGQIAVLTAVVTLTASVVGGCVAITVAFVNARAARNVARYNARTAYLQKMAAPLLESLDKRLAAFVNLVDRLTGFNPDLDKTESAWQREIVILGEHIHSWDVLDTTPLAIQTMKRSNPQLAEAYDAVNKITLRFIASVHSAMDERLRHAGTNAQRLQLIKDGKEALDKTVELRMALERHIFD